MRYLATIHGGRGIQSGRLSVPLATGGNIHLGLENLLKGESIDLSVARAVDSYRSQAEQSLGVAQVHHAHDDYTISEQSALVEALVRVYAIVALPPLLADYEVVEVESEYEFELAPDITWMSRLDGLLRRRSDGDLYVLSFKTDTGGHLESKMEDYRIDLQGLTEPEAVRRSGKYLDENGQVRTPVGVKMELLIKGDWKEEPKGSGLRFQDSYLVRPWSREGAVLGREWAWRYFTSCPGTPHEVPKPNGKIWKCPGDVATHGLGNTWKRTAVWQEMPIKEWIAMLQADQVQPGAGDPLTPCVYLSPPVMRSDADRVRAMGALKAQEVSVQNKINWLTSRDKLGLDPLLDEVFPLHTEVCNHSFGGPCQFKPICFAASPTEALLTWESNGFVQRTPHHKGELDFVQQLQGIPNG